MRKEIAVAMILGIVACDTPETPRPAMSPPKSAREAQAEGLLRPTDPGLEGSYVPSRSEQAVMDRLMKRLGPAGQEAMRRSLLRQTPGEVVETRIVGDASAQALLDTIYRLRRARARNGGSAVLVRSAR
jgi:hypothetical protein